MNWYLDLCYYFGDLGETSFEIKFFSGVGVVLLRILTGSFLLR